ncbi:hypothetical protein WMF38_45650 [Sorangium sp. So ce118]
MPSSERLPTGTDCYRFALSSPDVNACWAGPRDRAQLDAALAALDAGPMSDEELAWMRRVGVAVRDRTKRQARGMGVADQLANLVSGFGFRSTSELGQPASGGPSSPREHGQRRGRRRAGAAAVASEQREEAPGAGLR